jgi:NAD(P)-dependent dehydrogenase (short-subunit alcohol dehydrogenase family)
MSRLLDRKPIIVIGADEIGAGIARRLAREGAHLAVLDTDPPRADALAATLHADVAAGAPNVDAALSSERVLAPFAVSADYSAIGTAVETAAKRLGGVYALINNLLPTPTLASLESQTRTMFDDAFARIQATVCAMQTAMPFMRNAGEGRIVIVGHRYGESVNEGIAAYNAAAWSLVGITRSAALDWGRYQIATNLLLPLADTPELEQAHTKRPNIIKLMLSQLPLQRAGDCVEDIGGAALFLVSDAANFINGEVVHADGGQHVAGPILNPIRFAG